MFSLSFQFQEERRKEKEEKEYRIETDPYKANRARECLLFRIEGTAGDFTIWGFDYVRHLAGEIIYAHSALTAGLDSDDEMEVRHFVIVLGLAMLVLVDGVGDRWFCF